MQRYSMALLPGGIEFACIILVTDEIAVTKEEMPDKKPLRGADADPSHGARRRPRRSVVLAWSAGDPRVFDAISRLAEAEAGQAELIVAMAESVLTPDVRGRLPDGLQVVPVPGAPSLDELRRYGMLAASGDLIELYPRSEPDASSGDWAARLERSGAVRPR